ncbi:hypothetical protein F2Q69_00005748 [Brassica cretica]|uniref:Uncharacterized protein n=1 Tax=Brassica cretica TaxID=69181 RepID=A0A8S9PCF3_BRACR|nr:hypothetical protein F2Q69_00005748 [Brassica cretica]
MVYHLQTNQLCLTLIDPRVFYDPIPVIKPQTSSRRIDDGPGLLAGCHCGAEYDTEYSASIETHTPTSIDSANQKSIDNHLEESIASSPDDVIEYFPECPINSWENGYYNPTFAVDTSTPSDRANLHTEEYATSIDRTIPTSIDTHHYQTNCPRASTDIAYYTSFDNGVDHAQEGDYSIGSWANDHYHESYAVETTICEPRVDDPFKPKCQEFGKRAYNRDGIRRFHWEEKEEYGVYIDDHGDARGVDGLIIHVSKDDIRNLLEIASINEHIYICLPEHARLFTQTKLVPEIYTKDEINEMLNGICGAQEKNEDDF